MQTYCTNPARSSAQGLWSVYLSIVTICLFQWRKEESDISTQMKADYRQIQISKEEPTRYKGSGWMGAQDSLRLPSAPLHPRKAHSVSLVTTGHLSLKAKSPLWMKPAGLGAVAFGQFLLVPSSMAVLWKSQRTRNLPARQGGSWFGPSQSVFSSGFGVSPW